jgi:processive 1,2-diacylglycerol beta-glucosyltransferase
MEYSRCPSFPHTESVCEGLIIVAGASSGWGHMQAAFNLEAWLRKRSSSYSVQVIDVYDFLSPAVRFAFKTLWELFSCHSPSGYRWIYGSMSRSRYVWRHQQTHPSIQPHYRELCEPKVRAFIATHPAALQLGAFTKQLSGCLLFGVATDYIFHNLHCHPEVDCYFVPPQAHTTGEIARRTRAGYSTATVLPGGVPVSPEFVPTADKQKARMEAGIDPALFTIVVSFGGEGLGLKRNLALLQKIVCEQNNCQWVILCGRDSRVYRQAKRRFSSQLNVRILGFVRHIAAVMASADVLIGKAGGLTVTEAIHMCVPIIIIDKLPGQEDYNAEFVVQNGLGIESRSPKEICRFLAQLSRSSDARTNDQGYGGAFLNPSGSEIADQVLSAVEAQSVKSLSLMQA